MRGEAVDIDFGLYSVLSFLKEHLRLHDTNIFPETSIQSCIVGFIEHIESGFRNTGTKPYLCFFFFYVAWDK